MGWWDVAGLTPVVAFDANPDGVSGTTWLDRVGSNDMTFGGERKDTYPLLGLAGNGNLMPLTTQIALPAYFVFAALFNIKSNVIFGYKAAGDATSYMLAIDPSSWLGNANAGSSGNAVNLPGVFLNPHFIAVVRNSAGTYCYYNDSSFLATNNSYIMTALAGLGYTGAANSYNLSSADAVSTWGLWSGDAPLATVKALEAAARGAVTMPLPSPNLMGRIIRRPVGAQPVLVNRLVSVNVGRRDHYFGGGHSISGVVTIEGVPAQRIVRCHERLSNLVVAEKMSAPNGYYEFTHLDPRRRYYVVAFDHDEVYNMVGKDRIKFR